MPAPHIAFASSAISNPSSTTSSHAVAHLGHPTATGPLPLFPLVSAPITVSNAIPSARLDSNSHTHAYYNSNSYNTPSDRDLTATSRTGARAQAHISSAFVSPAAAISSAATVDSFAGSDLHPLSFRQRTTPAAPAPFSAASLPRTSSLLPPARVVAKTVPITNGNSTVHANAVNVGGATAPNRPAASTAAVAPYGTLNDPATTTAASSSNHRPLRSNSVGGVAPDLARLNNRWSASTAASSRASIAGSHQLYHRHQRSASFSRRLSVDSLGSSFRISQFEPTTTPSPERTQQSSPRKLQKSQPGTSNSGSPLRDRGSPLRSAALFTSLPPIIALPSLEQEVQGGTASLSIEDRQQRLPHVRQLSSEDNLQAFYLGELTTATTAGGPLSTTMYSRDHPEAVSSRGYTRSRSQAPNGSTDSTKSNKDRSSKPPSQKAMLSRALQKANTAVQLDNAGNIEGAREAYSEACRLLMQVLLKTPGEEDKRKLEAIKITYTARIEELDLIASTQSQDTRPLPQRPSSSSDRGRRSSEVYPGGVDVDSDTAVEPDEDLAQMSGIYNTDSEQQRQAEPRSIPGYSIPQSSSSPRPIQSGFPDSANVQHPQQHVSSLLKDQYTLQSTFSRSPRNEFIPPRNLNTKPNATGQASTLQPPPSANQYMPPPLSPRRIVPPSRPFEDAPTSYRYNPDEETLPSAHYGSTLRPGSANANNDDAAHAAYGHTRTGSHESVSWLDPIHESGSSAASSVHSRSSSMVIRRKHIRAASGATEAEFDAALDDAIEAAYNDGYEPMNSDPTYPASSQNNYKSYGNGDARVSKSLRKVELAKERVRETEREAIALERQLRLREQLMLQQQQEEEEGQVERRTPRDFLDDEDVDSDDEERILEEMTSGLAIEDFTFGLKQKSAIKPPPPRESDSSEFTSRTWHSSMASNPPTANTVLSTVSESTVLPPGMVPKGMPPPPPPPPTQALPSLPPQMPPPSRPSTAQTSPVRAGSAQSVRNRRLSGQNMKQLKIETTKLSPPSAIGPATTANNAATSTLPAFGAPPLPQQPRTAGFLVQQRQALSTAPGGPPALPGASQSRPGSSAAGAAGRPAAPTPSPGAGNTMFFGASPVETMPPPNFPPPTPPIPQGFDNDGRSGSPSTGRPGLRKNFSSSSLRSLRSRNMSLTNLDGDMSPSTPLTTQFSNTRLPDVPTLPTPNAATFKDRIFIAASGVGGMHLLDNDFHSPSTPGSPNPMYSDAPVPLEPCPTDTMLRPFWLMRCLYQTLVHPRGGYLSNKLFVPSDVWKVKGVRLKNVDEKVANCDFLTSALMKLAQVDTCDADAVLEEMQALENVLEHTQTTLARKLGNEVGVQSTSALFKEASVVIDADANGGAGGGGGSAMPRTSSVSGQSGSRSFSWRRLRSKNSSAGLNSNYNTSGGRKESVSDASGAGGAGGSKDGGPLASLPMTAQPTRRPAKRDVSSAKFGGPNAVYMNSLARLFDAAQSIDQIARQVEDPGLRHADKTQVGLELCTRHAAEFFAFFICRFVLSDVSLLLEKFIKRGSEWVMA
ncbi:uncharacterized protein SPSK_08301 [Sporothrix schenckii 1099-18]|uniref:MIT domain-containing protein n=1 Tax=Sporothrix schenckii 1099-18 TaxID=1397361 RepID=A0A0F2M552_SPOSC|nr:uncharacterized protein SPSK_08301 [Sporothrix schenckii 1099-18]KJR84752.1 hypothetical protein SPSK_08301 [Sporothrix schenckii 1099-18]